MKRIIVLTLLGAASIGAFAQGSMNLGNQLGATVFRAPISGPVPGSPTTEIHGQSTGALYFPTGSANYQGATFLSGAGFTFALYAGPAGTAENALTLVTTRPFNTGGSAGFITTSTVQIPGVDAGLTASFQIRAWDNASGATYALATIKGKSEVVVSGQLGGVNAAGTLFPINPDSVGWTAFNIYAVPEPSTFVLAGLGAAALVIFRRRK